MDKLEMSEHLFIKYTSKHFPKSNNFIIAIISKWCYAVQVILNKMMQIKWGTQ
jgi:hypothetical protein